LKPACQAGFVMDKTMIDQHTLTTLEFPRIIELIEGGCRTPYGHESVQDYQPIFDLKQIVTRQTEIAQMKDIILFGLAFPLSRLEDCRELLERSRVEGGFLDPEELMQIRELIEVSIDIYRYNKDEREKFPAINEYLMQVRAFPELAKEIRKAIDNDGSIKDSASQTLKKIRLDLVDSRRKIMRQLEQVLAGQQKQSGWQDDVITQRNGRYVIPVPASNYQSRMGILHDRSQSGATFFIEPQPVVELNNKLNQLDAIYAAAAFARKTDAVKPIMTAEVGFSLLQARHPLLLVQFKDRELVVANDVAINGGRQAIIVTGPNTGGKTIAVKTIGVLILMAQNLYRYWR